LSLPKKRVPAMIAKTVCVLAIIAIAAALVIALIRGRIEFNAAGSGLTANRATEPGSFWTIFCIGLAAITYLGWLVFGA
jgi:hypothetical protein